MTYRLEDVEKRHQEHPETFEIPSLKQRMSLKKGNAVKLIFLFALPEMPAGRYNGAIPPGREAGERMWVNITDVQQVDGQIRYEGRLDNFSVYDPELRHKTITFEPKHIASIWQD